MREDFPHLREKVADLVRQPGRSLTGEDMVDMVCRDCPFWKEDEKDYQCGGFRLVRLLLERGVVSVEGIARALGE